ncbi:MAG: S49 family peptidase [Haloarculaceae archaeon]
MAASSDSASTTTVLYVVVVVVAVLVATVLAPVVWSVASGSGDSDRSSVAVVTFRGGVNDQTASAISEDLREARNNDSVEAVVLRVDSPGGGVAASEELYLAVNRTAQEMPVVAYVEGQAASGGYYTIAPADSIVVKPSSQVGSIGVVVQAPISALEQADEQGEVFIRTGPDKAQIDKDSFLEEMESLQNAFGNTVMHHRGDTFTVDRETVLSGKVWLGTEAVQNGFADEIGSLETAIQRAASMSDDIEGDNYDVYYKQEPSIGIGIIFAQDDTEVEKVDGNVVYVDREADTEFVQPVKYYYIWGIPEDIVDEEEVTTNGTN